MALRDSEVLQRTQKLVGNLLLVEKCAVEVIEPHGCFEGLDVAAYPLEDCSQIRLVYGHLDERVVLAEIGSDRGHVEFDLRLIVYRDEEHRIL